MSWTKKDKLISALEKERNLFVSKGLNTTDHDSALEYLKTGIVGKETELLDAAMNDFDTLCSDYDVTDED